MKMKVMIAIALVSAVLCTVFAHQDDVARWDPNMAVQGVAVDTNGVKWVDGRGLPLEGKCFSDVEFFYDRLPSNVTERVNAGVRRLKHHTTGMQFRFKTDSRRLSFKWVPFNSGLLMHNNMAATGVSGIDVYRFDESKARWFYVNTGRITSPKGSELEIPWTPGTPCLVNLPLYNGIKSFLLGVDENAYVKPLGPRKSGVDKPVVFYGTSITHGGCASRPGLSFVNIIGRDLDVPVVNLGFSGSGRMELEMADHLARIDASCYVLDCLANMGDRPCADPEKAYGDIISAGFDENDPLAMIRFRYERFIRALRSKRPNVPIVMAEQGDVFKCGRFDRKNNFVRSLYEKLVAEGWNRLVYLPGDGMYNDDLEGTVDGIHPNDRGMETMAHAYGDAVKKALGLDS